MASGAAEVPHLYSNHFLYLHIPFTDAYTTSAFPHCRLKSSWFIHSLFQQTNSHCDTSEHRSSQRYSWLTQVWYMVCLLFTILYIHKGCSCMVKWNRHSLPDSKMYSQWRPKECKLPSDFRMATDYFSYKGFHTIVVSACSISESRCEDNFCLPTTLATTNPLPQNITFCSWRPICNMFPYSKCDVYL